MRRIGEGPVLSRDQGIGRLRRLLSRLRRRRPLIPALPVRFLAQLSRPVHTHLLPRLPVNLVLVGRDTQVS